MRSKHVCPKCECRELYVIDTWHEPDPDSSNVTNPVRVAFRMSALQRYEAVEFELWICSGCGLSEMYAKGVQNLAGLVGMVEGVRKVVGPGGGSYR